MEAAVLQQQLQYLRSDLQIAPMQHISICSRFQAHQPYSWRLSDIMGNQRQPKIDIHA